MSNPSINFLQQQAASLLLYQNVLDNNVGRAFISLLSALKEGNSVHCLQAYGSWFKTLAETGKNWQDYLIQQILWDDNPFSRQVQQISLDALPPALIAAVQYDLQALNSLYCCSEEQLSKWVRATCKMQELPVVWYIEGTRSHFLHQHNNWSEVLPQLAEHYGQNGTGIFSRYRALRWQEGQLKGISHADPIQLTEIVGYETQKAILIKNTEFLLAGYPALHVLLYGSRGSGKSSLVKGLLGKFGDRGLRLIEVSKSELYDLSAILEQLRNISQKFIIFVDDLSFEEDDEAFKSLKVVLEGSVTAKANNVLVYATSNRRHLIREFFEDRPRPRDSDEVHSWDTMQEKLSFSDRFGLTLTFEPANQDTYLEIIHHLALEANINLETEDLEFRAKQWATRHNGRSGRTARQFIDFLTAELSLENG
ncbi:ATP-binding protein [Spirulina sp. 06S082]|uniref:ATP-binding protein n=1 Tax=Spirulina sp. 06S082 TaxID=3110248 RepID=UPI002B1EA1EF|nr:ATP-binding protein [Spirulina sp. 06S082]MEA5471659.1 ATP-binding protein [Spirulina sp. 06S082]